MWVAIVTTIPTRPRGGRSARRTKLSPVAPTSFAAIQAASRSGADVVQLDLEDAVEPAARADARLVTVRGLRDIDWGATEAWVRVNPVGSADIAADVKAVVAGAPDAIVLAKVTGPDDLCVLAEMIAVEEKCHGLPEGCIGMVAVIESAAGLSAVERIATAHPRMTALNIGAKDLSRDCGYHVSPGGGGIELLYARSRCALAGRAAGIAVCDAAHTLPDLAGVARSADETFRMGFTTKTCRTPEQVPVIHRIYELYNEAVRAGEASGTK